MDEDKFGAPGESLWRRSGTTMPTFPTIDQVIVAYTGKPATGGLRGDEHRVSDECVAVGY